MRRFLLILLSALPCSTSAVADPQVLATSGPESSPMVIELFTSQGCSSCPPADAWLSRLSVHPGLWQAFVPLAWHVDYWDYLGWRDRFSNPAASARQRAYRESGSLGVVYTPALLVAGQETRRRPNEFAPEKKRPAGGILDLEVSGHDSQLRFKPRAGTPTEPLRGHLAILGMGLTTPVSHGENRGRTLREDFVVLRHLRGQARESDGAEMLWRFALVWPKDMGAARFALAAWVSSGSDPTPIQSVGAWLPEGYAP